MSRRKAFLGLALVAFGRSLFGAGPEAVPGAKEILKRVATTYAFCRSYQDSGVVETTFIQPDRNWRERKPFSTAFVRPNRFRFEFRSKIGNGGGEDRYLVWREGSSVRTWWDLKPGVETPMSLDLALAGATGVSDKSAHTVPALLLPEEIGGRRITDLLEPARIEDGLVGATACYRVVGNLMTQATTLWIDKASFLIRQIDAKMDFGNFRTKETTTYEPAIDVAVAESLLKFDPPGKK